MALTTSGLLLASGALSAGGSAYNIIQGAKAKSEANQAAASAANSIAQMQEADKFRNLQVPTLGLEMAQQNVQARQAQQLQGLQDIGAAGVLGGLTALNTQGQAQDLALAAQAQNAQYERDLYQAQNAQAIEQRRMGRLSGLEQQRLLGAQAASAYGQQQINAGITGLAQTAGNVLVQSLKDKSLFEDATKPPVKTTAGTTVTPTAAAAQTPTITTLTGEQIQQNAQSAFNPQVNSMLPAGMQTLTPEVAGGLGLTAPAVITPEIGTEAVVNANPATQEDAEYKKMIKQAMIDLSKDPVNIENWKRRGLRWNPVTQETELMFDELGIDPVTFERKKK
jgi:hypothetical protein